MEKDESIQEVVSRRGIVKEARVEWAEVGKEKTDRLGSDSHSVFNVNFYRHRKGGVKIIQAEFCHVRTVVFAQEPRRRQSERLSGIQCAQADGPGQPFTAALKKNRIREDKLISINIAQVAVVLHELFSE